MRNLYFGDNLDVLQQHIEPESVDLAYLDPPFNSQAGYNLLYESPGNQRETAQQQIFRDMWSWGDEAEHSFRFVLGYGGQIAAVLNALTIALQRSDMMAYLAMMSARLIEIHRALKPTGSLYLHCDPTASHYLKIVLDAIFGPDRFLNEVIWKRTSAHSAAQRWNDVHDSILFFRKSESYRWNKIFTEYDDAYKARYRNADADGRMWADDNLTAPGVRHGDSGSDWRGFNPTTKGNHWKVSNAAVIELVGEERADRLSTTEKLDVLDKHGLIHWPKSGGFPRFKRVLGQGLSPQDIFDVGLNERH